MTMDNGKIVIRKAHLSQKVLDSLLSTPSFLAFYILVYYTEPELVLFIMTIALCEAD